jgi:hypothetical protein
MTAPPRIDELQVDQGFYWCINYRVTGVPPPTRTWYHNNQPLNMSDNIQDLESAASAKDLYFDEGIDFFFCF